MTYFNLPKFHFPLNQYTSSLNFPKKGFKIKFRKKELFQGHTKRFDVSASYVDKSLIRERLSW